MIELKQWILQGQDWLAQTWLHGGKKITTIVPPKHARDGSGHVQYDTEAAERLALSMMARKFKAANEATDDRERIERDILAGSATEIAITLERNLAGFNEPELLDAAVTDLRRIAELLNGWRQGEGVVRVEDVLKLIDKRRIENDQCLRDFPKDRTLWRARVEVHEDLLRLIRALSGGREAQSGDALVAIPTAAVQPVERRENSATPSPEPIKVVAGVRQRGGLYWICQRNGEGEHDELAGMWEYPGGKVDLEDASIYHALIRELGEEFGVNARVGKVLDVVTSEHHGKQYEVTFIECDFDDEPELRCHQQSHWATVNELPNFRHLPSGEIFNAHLATPSSPEPQTGEEGPGGRS